MAQNSNPNSKRSDTRAKAEGHLAVRTLTASGKPVSETGRSGDTLITLASGRVVRVRHGQDFATLIRHSA